MLSVKCLPQSPLVQAIFSRNAEEVTFLLNHNEDVNSLDQEQSSPLHAAAYLGDVHIMGLIINSDANVNAKDQGSLTPLHRAAASRNEVSLIPHVCSLDVTDKSGRTPLHHASHSGHGKMVNLLLSKGANISAKDKKERQAIHWAAYLGHLEVVKLLVSHSADVMCKDKCGYTPLHAASASGQLDVVKYLLKLGVEADEPNIFGNTALHMACHMGQDTVATELVNCGANINQANYHGNTPLHLAAASSSGVLCLELLINNGADVNMQNKEGKSPLHMAAMHGRFTGSQILIQNGGEIDCVDVYGNTPLHVAARYGQELLISTLLTNGADKSRQGIHGISPLHYAAANGNRQCTMSLVRAGAEVNELDLTGCSPLHYVAASHTFYTNSEPDYSVEKEQEASLCLDFLLDNGANPTLKNSKGYSAVHYAAACGNKQHLELVSSLFDLDALTLFFHRHFTKYQAYYGHCEALCLLCETLVSLDVRDIEGRTALHLAARRGFVSCVEVLLKHQASYTLKEHKHKWTALHAVLGSEDCVSALLEHGASALCRDSQGRTPLHLAASRGHAKLLHSLIKAALKADPLDSLLDHRGYTPTHWASYQGHEGCLKILLENKLFSNQEGNLFTPLHCALVNGHDDAAELLVKVVGRQIVIVSDAKERTPLHAAAYSGNVAGLQLVLAQGAEVNAVDHCGLSALMVAADCGQTAAVEFLLHKAKPDLTLVDVNNNTALHLACSKGHEMCALLILGEISDSSLINATNSALQMPLHIAARKGLATVVQVLLSRGAAVMAVDEEGHTPALACAPNKNVADCLALILSTMKPFPPKEATGGTASHFNHILKNCGIANTCGANGNLCHA
uniref:Ankyrin repeat domain 52 n=1 Tax=Anabas testudineus TaxID=64144 RepID=A0A7N6BGH6_ANATE